MGFLSGLPHQPLALMENLLPWGKVGCRPFELRKEAMGREPSRTPPLISFTMVGILSVRCLGIKGGPASRSSYPKGAPPLFPLYSLALCPSCLEKSRHWD